MELRLPQPLTPGSCVALVAPARFASPELLESAATTISDWGYEPVIAEETRARDRQFGGTDAQRASALNAAFRDPDVGAVWALRGGYGCTRLLPLLDGRALQTHPTWITGFSDITALHGWASGLGVAALHAPVASTLASTDASDVEALREVWRTGRPAAPQGSRRVVGGNLSVLYALLGTPHMPPLEGRWLLLEDLDEYLYHLDRMFVAFAQAGVFEAVEGVMVGTFTDLRDNTKAFGQAVDNPFGRTARDIIEEHVVGCGCAVEWDVPVGHGTRNAPLVLG